MRSSLKTTGRSNLEKSTFEVRSTCKDCRFSDSILRAGAAANDSTQITVCRFNPPIVAHAFMPAKEGSIQVMQQSLWPIMTVSDWCGKLETRSN
jgi:hypothetical protein